MFVQGHLEDPGLGGGLFEFDLVADEGHDSMHRGIGRVGGNDREAHFGAFGAADLLDHLAELHVHHLHRRLVALGHGDDLVLRLELFTALRRAAIGQALDLADAVLGLQQRPNTIERELHPNREIFQFRLAHVVRVRVKDMAEGGKVNLKDVVVIVLVDHPENAGVAANQVLDDVVGLLLV